MNYIQLDRRMVALILIELLARNFLVTQAINTRSMLITNWAQKWISSLNSSSSAIKKMGLHQQLVIMNWMEQWQE